MFLFSFSHILRLLEESQEGPSSEPTEEELAPVSETESKLKSEFLPQPEVQEQHPEGKGRLLSSMQSQ